MYLQDVMENKYVLMSSAALLLVPYFTWKALYNAYRNLQKKYAEEVLFHNRHNCVVMYSGSKGMSGWPPHTGRVRIDINRRNCLSVLHEPVIYFIDTANVSLDLAFMLISTNSVFDALVRAHKKGVKVKVLLNFEHCDSKLNEIRNLIKEGIEVLTYVSQGLSSIMHYKCIIKDYTDSSGFLLTGSLNLTDSGFVNNYEDVVFTSNRYVVEAFYENFKECWSFVKTNNEDIINKTTLLDANLL